MGVEWFYKHEGRVYGPLSLSDLRAALLLGFVSPSDLVCNREINGWRKASDLSELQTPNTDTGREAEGDTADGTA